MRSHTIFSCGLAAFATTAYAAPLVVRTDDLTTREPYVLEGSDFTGKVGVVNLSQDEEADLEVHQPPQKPTDQAAPHLPAQLAQHPAKKPKAPKDPNARNATAKADKPAKAKSEKPPKPTATPASLPAADQAGGTSEAEDLEKRVAKKAGAAKEAGAAAKKGADAAKGAGAAAAAKKGAGAAAGAASGASADT